MPHLHFPTQKNKFVVEAAVLRVWIYFDAGKRCLATWDTGGIFSYRFLIEWCLIHATFTFLMKHLVPKQLCFLATFWSKRPQHNPNTTPGWSLATLGQVARYGAKRTWYNVSLSCKIVRVHKLTRKPKDARYKSPNRVVLLSRVDCICCFWAQISAARFPLARAVSFSGSLVVAQVWVCPQLSKLVL